MLYCPKHYIQHFLKIILDISKIYTPAIPYTIGDDVNDA